MALEQRSKLCTRPKPRQMAHSLAAETRGPLSEFGYPLLAVLNKSGLEK